MRARGRAGTVDLARVEQHWALARIFTPLRRGERPRLDATLQSGEVTFRVVGPWALGIDDLGVLLALVRLGVHPERSDFLTNEPRTREGRTMAAELEVRLASVWETLVVDTRLRELARITGRPTGGSNLRSIRHSLLRLAAVTVFVQSRRAIISAHVLGWSGIAEDGGVRVALHPHVAAAVIGGGATLIDMAAWRQLRGEVARRLLVWLSGWLSEGETRTVRLDTLTDHVWSAEATDRRRACERRHAVAEALEVLDELAGWTTRVVDRQATVSRHRSGVRHNTGHAGHNTGQPAAFRRTGRGISPDEEMVENRLAPAETSLKGGPI